MKSLSKFLVSALAGTQLVSADVIENPTIAEQISYPEWAFVMTPFVEEYSWNPIEVTTADGYVLTMFQISKRFSDCESTQSVLYQHGYGFDSTETVGLLTQVYPGEKPHLLKVVDECYDVYMSNFRGTRYSL